MEHELDNKIMTLLEQVIDGGPEQMGQVFTGLFNLAMRMERERFLQAGHYERRDTRQGYANGSKQKRIDTPAGTLTVEVPKTRGSEQPFYPQSLERGRRSSRAVMLAVAEMYIKGVSTRQVESVLAHFGLDQLSSTQVSRATQQLDTELEQWRNRPLGAYPYLLCDARYEKVRIDGIVRDEAILSVIGVDGGGHRSVLGVSCALSEAEVHWRTFLDSLVKRGLRGVAYIVSDDHAGLDAARRAVFAGATWQRCQFHLAQNAQAHAPTVAIRRQIGAELRDIWNARSLAQATERLEALVGQYEKTAPALARWLTQAVPEGLAVFSLPKAHWRRLRTANPIERCLKQEIKRRTRTIRVFPNKASLLRLVTAILVEIDDGWTSAPKTYINWEADND